MVRARSIEDGRHEEKITMRPHLLGEEQLDINCRENIKPRDVELKRDERQYTRFVYKRIRFRVCIGNALLFAMLISHMSFILPFLPLIYLPIAYQ